MAKLWQRTDNKVYYVLWQENGRQRKKSLKTRNKRKATRRFNNFKRLLSAGKITPISRGPRQKFRPFIVEFLDYIETVTELSTYKLYDIALAKAESCWGNIPLSHITTRHVDNLVAELVNAGLAVPTVNKYFRHVKAALSKAYEWNYLKAPIRFPKPLREKRRLRYLTKQQLAKLIGKIDDLEFADFCLFSAYTGLRSGEILRLKWSDIDNPRSFMKIGYEQKNKEDAWIPINSNTRAILQRCRRRSHKTSKVFRFASVTWVSQKFKQYARNAGLHEYRFHDLRHTYASHLAMKGENEVAIQELMRHRSIASTLVYTRVSRAYLRRASEKVNYGPMPVGKKKRTA